MMVRFLKYCMITRPIQVGCALFVSYLNDIAHNLLGEAVGIKLTIVCLKGIFWDNTLKRYPIDPIFSYTLQNSHTNFLLELDTGF